MESSGEGQVRSFGLHVPRHAVSPRQVARAGEIWRLCQEAAVQASSEGGWPPERYIEESVSFIVSRMTVSHDREVGSGEPLVARTWVHDFRRGILSKRQVTLSDRSDASVARATQQWVHVAGDGAGNITPARASPALLRDFAPVQVEGAEIVRLPSYERRDPSPAQAFEVQVWHTWMDPLAHANHPAYVDWCDEGTSRILVAAGVDPQCLAPVCEEVTWKTGAVAGDRVVVETSLVGILEDPRVGTAAVLSHRMVDPTAEVRFANATTVRGLIGLAADESTWQGWFAG
jgi:acyl-CoA thioesterase FadM